MSIKREGLDAKKEGASMHDTKVFSALTHLSVYELNRFRKFLQSPYFNKNESITALFDCFEPLLRSESGSDMSRGATWRQCYGKAPYNDLKFRKLCSDLLKLLERFLSQEVFETNSLHQADCLLQAVNQRKLESLYNSSIRTAQRLSDQYYFRPASYYYHQYAFQREIFALSGHEIVRSKVANVEAIAENLDKFYLSEKMRYYCDVLSRKHFLKHDYHILFMDEIIEHIESKGYESVIPINFYYQIYLTHKEAGNLQHFEKLKALIDEHAEKLPPTEAREIFDSARNYCIGKLNAGDLEFLREYMDLSMIGLRTKILMINGFITPWTFRNIVVTGLRLGEFDWVEQFILEYQDQIEEKYRRNAVSFNLANLYFYRRDFDKVLSELQTVEYEDPSYNLNSKTILIATYYELDEPEPLMSLLTSFSVYLRRHPKVKASRQDNYLNFIRFMRKLVSIPIRDKVAISSLRSKVEATSGVVNKNWLLEKIDELL